MILKVQIVHEQKNDNWMGLIEGESDIVEIVEDGAIDSAQIVAVSAYHEYCIVYMLGGHSFILEEEYDIFVKRWIKSTHNTINKDS
jgi:hypothetical protein